MRLFAANRITWTQSALVNGNKIADARDGNAKRTHRKVLLPFGKLDWPERSSIRLVSPGVTELIRITRA